MPQGSGSIKEHLIVKLLVVTVFIHFSFCNLVVVGCRSIGKSVLYEVSRGKGAVRAGTTDIIL